MLDVRLVDAFGTGAGPKIEAEGTLNIVNHGHPPKGETVFTFPFRERFADTNGSVDMTVDGSSTNVEFKVCADPLKDIFVRTMSIIIGDGGSPALNKFGALTALTNGVEIKYLTSDQGELIIHDGIKTNLEFIRFGADTGAIGTGVDAYLADVSGGATEKSYLPVIDVVKTFGFPFGLRLRAGTDDCIVYTVKDDLTGLTTFDVIAYGVKI